MYTLKKLLFTLLSVAAIAVSENINISSSLITNWGVWGEFQRCPHGKYVKGFQLKMDHYNKISSDYTGLNGIKLFCGNSQTPTTPVLISAEGKFGNWGKVHDCSTGFLNGFQLKVDSYQENEDETATNDVKFFCSGSKEWLAGDQISLGEWCEVQNCGSNQFITGLQTQVEPYQEDDGDDVSLNNVLVECCDYAIPAM